MKPEHLLTSILESLPQRPQRQDSTEDQLRDLAAVADRLGMYDAADSIRARILKPSTRRPS
jgi:hypothetical protein